MSVNIKDLEPELKHIVKNKQYDLLAESEHKELRLYAASQGIGLEKLQNDKDKVVRKCAKATLKKRYDRNVAQRNNRAFLFSGASGMGAVMAGMAAGPAWPVVAVAAASTCALGWTLISPNYKVSNVINNMNITFSKIAKELGIDKNSIKKTLTFTGLQKI